MVADERLVLMMSVLLHDVGKATCTRTEFKGGRDRITSPGHEVAGAEGAARFLRQVGFQESTVQRVVPLVANHMVHAEAPSARMVRRLAVRLVPSSIEELCAVMTADASGRPPRPPGVPVSVQKLRAAAADLQVQASAPVALLQGRYLLSKGWTGGRQLGAILKEAYSAQLDGEFTDLDGALHWVSERAWNGDGLRGIRPPLAE
jgi:tRNA nucleotidyltransferase (CCA-adding enzyme)